MPEAAQRKALAQELGRLNANMRSLAEKSEATIRKATSALQAMDKGQAEEVFAMDREIYSLQNAIESNCIDLIALHAPVARDLRAITTSLKIVTDLDRIGRYARDIAEIAVALSEKKLSPHRQGEKLGRMANLTIHMVDTAVRAYTNHDATSVRDIAEFDNAVDDLYDEISKDLVRDIADASVTAETGVQYILVCRYLERIADHAVNVGHRVVYMVTGERTVQALKPNLAT